MVIRKNGPDRQNTYGKTRRSHMSDINKDVHKHGLLGGRLCLDFANTVSWHDSSEKSQELLTSYEKLVNWSLHANILTKQQSLSLLKKQKINLIRQKRFSNKLSSRGKRFSEFLV